MPPLPATNKQPPFKIPSDIFFTQKAIPFFNSISSLILLTLDDEALNKLSISFCKIIISYKSKNINV